MKNVNVQNALNYITLVTNILAFAQPSSFVGICFTGVGRTSFRNNNYLKLRNGDVVRNFVVAIAVKLRAV